MACRARQRRRMETRAVGRCRTAAGQSIGLASRTANGICTRIVGSTDRPSGTDMSTASHGNLWDNPLGTDGFEFIEYAAPDPLAMGRLFEQMGFTAVARHRAKNVLLYRQGNVNFIVNAEPESFAQAFARVHGPSICAIAFRVKDAAFAFKSTVDNGAWGVEARPGPMELNIPAIKGIGDSLIYLVDRYAGNGTGVS